MLALGWWFVGVNDYQSGIFVCLMASHPYLYQGNLNLQAYVPHEIAK